MSLLLQVNEMFLIFVILDQSSETTHLISARPAGMFTKNIGPVYSFGNCLFATSKNTLKGRMG